MACSIAGARMSGRVFSVSGGLIALSIAALGCLLAAGCASSGAAKKPPAGLPEPDKFLWDHGNEEMAQKKYSLAVEYYRQLVDTYPQSPYRASAKLGTGDAYLGEHSPEALVLAANEFREFLSFYPTHPYAYYAQYKLAMTHFYQMRAPMRDQTETRSAITELQTFLQKYPDSPLVKQAQESLRLAKDRLDDWDYGVAVEYFHMKWYPGTVDRLRPLIDSDPGYTGRDGAYYYLAESYMALKPPQSAAALPLYERLVKEFEQSQYLVRAKKRIEEIKAEQAAKAKGSRP